MVTYTPQPISIYLRQDQLDALQVITTRRGVSLDELIQQGVDSLLQTELPPAAAPSLRGIIGLFHSGLGDLAARHDDYLAEAVAAEREP
ncbi:MAG: hypothetical protein M3Z04_05425 [Chloroflexota bacterium]|nr:hypothetical protein [Chloroflexota bacterium]